MSARRVSRAIVSHCSFADTHSDDALPVVEHLRNAIRNADFNRDGRRVPLARTMNLKTTAECIESETIQVAVGALGVDFGQGFAIGRPRPVEQVLQDLLRGSAGVVRPLVIARTHRLVS